MLLRPILGLTAAVVVTGSAFAGQPESVAPIQAVMQQFGDSHVLAYYTQAGDRCDLVVMTGDEPGARVRVSLAQAESAKIEDVSGGAMSLTCGAGATRMTVDRQPPTLKAASAEE
jgi:hypothetical protein